MVSAEVPAQDEHEGSITLAAAEALVLVCGWELDRELHGLIEPERPVLQVGPLAAERGIPVSDPRIGIAGGLPEEAIPAQAKFEARGKAQFQQVGTR